MKTPHLSLLLAPLAVLAASGAFVVVLVAGGPVALGILAAAGVAVVAVLVPYLRAEASVVGRLEVSEVHEREEPRLFNIVEGLCDSHGFRRPRLAVIESEAANAVVYGRRSDRVTLALTRGVLDSLSRMELEGLLARELAVANRRGAVAATVLVPLLALLPPRARPALVRRVLGEQREVLDDREAVRLTRYPPGLAAALDRLGRGSTVVAGAGANSGHLWVAPPAPVAPAPGAFTVEERVDVLREL